MDFAAAKEKVFSELGLTEVNSGVFSGEWGPIAGRETIEVHSAINGELLAQVAVASPEDYNRVVTAAQVAFDQWRDVPAPVRGEIVREIGDELRKYKETLGLLVSLEVGKTIVEGQGEVQEMIDIANFATGLSRQIYGLTIASERPHHRLFEQWHPLGVVGVITTFNFPCAVWSWNALIAAVVGDSLIWKPSPLAPLTAIAVTRIVHQVLARHDMPPVFLLAVDQGRMVGESLTNDPNVALVSFTGSIPTGKVVSKAVSSRLGRVLLELGGNNGAIVTEQADMDVALKGVAFGALATAGQRCTTTRRLILQESIYDEFLERLVKAYESVKIGNPLEEGVLVGPLINEQAVENYLNAIKRAQAEGGRLVYGGQVVEIPGLEGGHYVMPTIIEGAPEMDIVCEETFAPILYVLKFRTLEEGVRIHNSVPQGLSSAIFTTDLREAEYFLSHRGSDCGLANVNTSTAGAEIGGAFGGEKETGGGRESGSDAWKVYARRQTVTINYGYDLPLAQGVKFDI